MGERVVELLGNVQSLTCDSMIDRDESGVVPRRVGRVCREVRVTC